MYSENNFHVRVQNGTKLTPPFPCDIGIRQGDSLSPTLFNIFVNDIAEIFNDNSCEPARIGTQLISCLFYADDLVILSESEICYTTIVIYGI